MPLVAECSERCTPWASGCWPSGRGERGVDQRDRAAQSAPISSRSTSSSSGFDGVSAIASIVRPGLHRGGEGAGLGAVDERDLDAEAGARPLQEGERGRVQLALGDDVVALPAQRQHDAC